MATSNPSVPKAAWVVLGGLALLVAAAVLLSLRSPPQMGPHAEVFETVDALYTAVRNRDEARLTQCEMKLAGYRAAGTLPKAAADRLDGVIAKARAGDWQPAAERLYDFMLAQRRDGAEAPAKPAPPPKGKAK